MPKTEVIKDGKALPRWMAGKEIVISDDHPLVIAWNAYKVQHEINGLSWAAFVAGYEASTGPVFQEKSILPKLKPLPEPATSSKPPEQQADKQLQIALLETIAIRVPFSFQAVSAFYNHYKSYDLLIASCDYAIKNGLTVLLLPPAEYI